MNIFDFIELAKKSKHGVTWFSDKGPIHISKDGRLEPIKLGELPIFSSEWNKTSKQKPMEGEKVEFPADKERDGIIRGMYSDGCFWSSFDGYHEPDIWRYFQE